MATEPRRRKPLRRTAWSLLIGGLVTLVLMIGVGLLILAGGEDIGPGRPAMWPAGERVSVHKHLGLPAEKANTPGCEVIGPDGQSEYRWLDWGESFRSSTEVTLDCEREAILLTGIASEVVSAVQSPPLFAAPVAAVLFGVLLFFPRFTLAWARFANYRFRWLVDKPAGRDRDVPEDGVLFKGFKKRKPR